MVEWNVLKPFRALRYEAQHGSGLADVMAPPYDVITPSEQECLYKSSPFNIVRIDFNKTTGDQKYQEAGHLFHKWQVDGILHRDARPAFYLHHQTFTLPDGKRIVRRGFFALRRISETGVKPHEKTLEGPKADRLKLMLATRAHLSPIFSLYSDPEKRIDGWVSVCKARCPDVSFVAQDGHGHELWVMDDLAVAAQIDLFLAERPVVIADGHHRYETAENFLKLCREGQAGRVAVAAAEWVLMYLANLSDPGLIVLPIHRAVHALPNFSAEALLSALRITFAITPVRVPTAADGSDPVRSRPGCHCFVMLCQDGKAYTLSLEKARAREHTRLKDLPESIRDLDVSVLHHLVLEGVMGLSAQAQADQTNLIYWKDTQKAIVETLSGRCQATFLLKATDCAQVERAALGGHTMPQKSTYFYPKILTGLVINPLDEG